MRNVRIPTREPGIFLAGDVYLPDTEVPVPALVSVLPYRKDLIAGIGSAASLHWFAAHGYAALLVDSRGTGSSDGAPRPPFDAREADDGVAAVEWASRQPWCTGAVGMWGMSYGAIMTLRTASHRPTGLKAIIPLMGTPDPGADFIHPGGSRGCLAPLGLWGMSTLLCLLLPPLEEPPEPGAEARWLHRLENAEPYLLDLHRHGPGDPVWPARAIDAGEITVPTLCVAGWRDLMCDGTIRAYEQIKGPKRLVAGPWMHTPPHESPFDPADFHGLALRWWDRWLAGIRNGADEEPPVTVFIQGSSPGWRHFAAWPPPGGDLTLTVDADRTPRSTGDGPAPAAGNGTAADGGAGRSAGALGGLWFAPTTGYGLPLDQHDDDMRSTTFTGQPLDSPLMLAGRPTVTLGLAGAQPDARVIVKLTDVDPQGRSTLISAGLPGGTGTASGSPSMRHVVLSPTAYRVPAGHRVRVVVACDDFPRLWPAPGGVPADGRPAGTAVTTVTVTLPAVSPSEGRPASMAPPGEVPPGEPVLALHHQPRWAITRDLIHDSITVTIGEENRSQVPSGSHIVEWRSEISASTADGSRASAEIRGTCTAVARAKSGQTITASIELHVTETAATTAGNVTIGGTEVFARRWETPQASPAPATSRPVPEGRRRQQRTAHEPLIHRDPA